MGDSLGIKEYFERETYDRGSISPSSSHPSCNSHARETDTSFHSYARYFAGDIPRYSITLFVRLDAGHHDIQCLVYYYHRCGPCHGRGHIWADWAPPHVRRSSLTFLCPIRAREYTFMFNVDGTWLPILIFVGRLHLYSFDNDLLIHFYYIRPLVILFNVPGQLAIISSPSRSPLRAAHARKALPSLISSRAGCQTGTKKSVRAHFQLQYPLPRGPFNEDSEPTFCDGYTDAVDNRTIFPLSNGIINMNSEHPVWTAGVIVSTDQNPNNFSDFNSSSGYQFGVNFFQQSGEGQYCFPIDLAAANVSGIKDGANVTIQVIFQGGDGLLYQCADLTLSANTTMPPANATSSCTNVTSSPTPSSTSSGSARKGVEVASGYIAVACTMMVTLLSFL